MDSKVAARTTIDDARERLVALSHRIHAHPELKFEEEQSSAWTAGDAAAAMSLAPSRGRDTMSVSGPLPFGAPMRVSRSASYRPSSRVSIERAKRIIAASLKTRANSSPAMAGMAR